MVIICLTFISWLSFCTKCSYYCVQASNSSLQPSLSLFPPTSYMFSPCPPSAGLQTLWSLISSLSLLLSLPLPPSPSLSLSVCLSLRPPPPLYLFSLNLYLFCLSSSGTLYTPVSLLTSPASLFSPYLNSHWCLQSRQCTFSVTVPLAPPSSLHLPPSLSLCSLDMDKFFPVFSLTKRPSVSDTGCLGNHRAPVTLSHLSMSRTNMHAQTHEHPLAAHAYTKLSRKVQRILCALADA